MSINQQIALRSTVLKEHVKKYAILGLVISISSIILASFLVSYQLTGEISLWGFVQAQKTNPAIWALDLTPFMFAYWGQAFSYELASKAELIIEDKTRELVTKSGDLESKLKYETNHDNLTNLPNSRLLSQRINQDIQQLQKDENLVVIIVNINDFKEINYKFGSFSANSLLIQFTEKLKSILLEPYMLQAYMGMNMVARLQGAGFAFLIPRLHKEHQLETIITNILEETSVGFMIDGNSIELSTIAGVAIYPQHGKNDEELLHHASLSLLHAVKKNQAYAVYEPSMSRIYQTKMVLLKELHKAIDNDEIKLLYQPIIELSTGKIVGAEAITYFEEEKYGLITSDKMMPLIEGTGLMKTVTLFTLKHAIKQLALWRQVNPHIHLRVGILDSTETELPNKIAALLKEHDLPPSCLKIELTEKVCLSDQTHSINVLQQLSELGIDIAISDFGSGYSSFIYLSNFPIDEIKIDPSFTRHMMEDKKKHQIVKAIVKLAGAMDLAVFADGIQNEIILNELKRLGCLYGQGPYFYDAINVESFVKLLHEDKE